MILIFYVRQKLGSVGSIGVQLTEEVYMAVLVKTATTESFFKHIFVYTLDCLQMCVVLIEIHGVK